eukprot:1541445-Prymnesium_polylepis.1
MLVSLLISLASRRHEGCATGVDTSGLEAVTAAADVARRRCLRDDPMCSRGGRARRGAGRKARSGARA